jgi:mRNA interferase MazF
LLQSKATGLPKDSVANVSQIFTVDKKFLVERIGMLPEHLQKKVDEGLRTVLHL